MPKVARLVEVELNIKLFDAGPDGENMSPIGESKGCVSRLMSVRLEPAVLDGDEALAHSYSFVVNKLISELQAAKVELGAELAKKEKELQ
jgi:hypothetical protein